MIVTPETCRICLGKQHLDTIFQKGRAEKIKFCASVQISEDDELPKMICKQCIFYLDIAYVFRTVCEATDARLRIYFEDEKKKQEDVFFYIDSPVANEVVIGDDVVEDEAEEIHLPVHTEEQESITTSVSERKDSQQNIVPDRSDFSESEEEIHLPSMEKIIQELCVSPVDEMMNLSKNTVPEDSPKSDDSKKESANKLGRHTARKKLANVQKRIPTVGDKSKVAKIPTKDEDEIKNGNTGKNKNASELATPTTEEAAKQDILEVENANKMKEVKIIVHQVVHIKPISQNIENSEKKPSNSAPKSKVKVELINEIPATEEKNEEVGKKSEIEVKQNEPSKSYKCDVCEKSFSYKSHLERHSSVHSGVKEFKCTDCDKKFVNQYNLTVHKEKHTGKFRHKCKECGQGFPSPSVLKRHMNSHSKSATFQCKYCSKKLLHSSSLKIHEKMHLNRPSYTCDICFKEFSYTSSLTEHKKTHQSLKGNVCIICGKQFARKTSLRRHMLIHKPKNVQNLDCDQCHKHFKSKELLIKHLKQHTGLNRKL